MSTLGKIAGNYSFAVDIVMSRNVTGPEQGVGFILFSGFARDGHIFFGKIGAGARDSEGFYLNGK